MPGTLGIEWDLGPEADREGAMPQSKPRMILFQKASLRFLRLRPYGDSLLTPAVRVWLGFAWVIILLMASVEGIVWGLVGGSIVPQDTAWLRPIAGLFLFALMFSVIWIVDASLVMSERPVARARRWNPGVQSGRRRRLALGLRDSRAPPHRRHLPLCHRPLSRQADPGRRHRVLPSAPGRALFRAARCQASVAGRGAHGADRAELP